MFKKREKSSFREKPKFFRKRVCRFCIDKVDEVDYKDVSRLQRYVTERGKITPRRISGNCAPHQRKLNRAIKRARYIGLLAYTAE